MYNKDYFELLAGWYEQESLGGISWRWTAPDFSFKASHPGQGIEVDFSVVLDPKKYNNVNPAFIVFRNIVTGNEVKRHIRDGQQRGSFELAFMPGDILEANVFPSFAPEKDSRILGIQIADLRVLTHPGKSDAVISQSMELNEGWHEVERGEGKAWRWSASCFSVTARQNARFVKMLFSAVLDLNPRNMAEDSDYATIIARNVRTGEQSKKHFINALQIISFEMSIQKDDRIEFVVNPAFLPPQDPRELGIQVQAIEAVMLYSDMSFTPLSITPFEKVCDQVFVQEPGVAQAPLQGLCNLKMVLAFYYIWYGTPSISGEWRHWDGTRLHEGVADNILNTPQLGLYDSADRGVIRQHLIWMEDAGVDGLIVSWWNDERDLPAIRILGEEAVKSSVRLSFHVEYDGVRKCSSLESVVEYLYGLFSLIPEESMLRIEGRPVFFIHVLTLSVVPTGFWKIVQERMLQRYSIAPLFLADESDSSCNITVNGTYTYNWFWNECLANNLNVFKEQWSKGDRDSYAKTETFCDVLGEVYEFAVGRRVRMAEKFGSLSTATVSPGFNDTHLYSGYGLEFDRSDGKLLKKQWDIVIALQPSLVLINSWNELHEGSDFEPSTSQGTFYLDMMKQYIKLYKQPSTRKRNVYTTLCVQGNGKKAIVLPQRVPANYGVPNPGSTDLYFLYESGYTIVQPPVDFFIKAIDEASSTDLLVFPGDTFVLASASEPFDILERATEFIRRGGTFIVASHLNFPMQIEANLTRDIYYGDVPTLPGGLRNTGFMEKMGFNHTRVELSPYKYEYERLKFLSQDKTWSLRWGSEFSANWFDVTLGDSVLQMESFTPLVNLVYGTRHIGPAVICAKYHGGGKLVYVYPDLSRCHMYDVGRYVLEMI